MDFRLSTSVSITDQDTGEVKPYDEWEEADYIHAQELLSDYYHMAVIPDYEVVKSRGDHITKGGDNYGEHTQRISVDKEEVMMLLKDDIDGIVQEVGGVEVDNHYFEPTHYFVEGEVRGQLGYRDKLDSKVARITPCDFEDYKLHSALGTGDLEDTWHVFSLRIPAVCVLEQQFTASDYEQAIHTGEGGVDVEFVTF